MEKCGDTKHNDKNDDETDTSLNVLDKGKERLPDITFPNIMEECGNKKYGVNNEYETDSSIYTIKRVKENYQI